MHVKNPANITSKETCGNENDFPLTSVLVPGSASTPHIGESSVAAETLT